MIGPFRAVLEIRINYLLFFHIVEPILFAVRVSELLSLFGNDGGVAPTSLVVGCLIAVAALLSFFFSSSP